MGHNLHRTLRRQLLKAGLDPSKAPADDEKWKAFLENISKCYSQHDEDRYLMERSLDISSLEMQREIKNNREMSMRLAQAGKLASLATLASGIAHELNNPLTVVLGFAELLVHSPNLSEKDRKTLDKIISVGHRMAGTIRHMLKLSRQDDGEFNSVVDIGKCIEESLQLLKRQFEGDDINLKIEIPNEKLNILGNENSIVGVFHNLLTNSRDAFISSQANKGNRKISLSVSRDGPQVKVIYSDNAGGIPNKILAKIFDPFFTTKGVGQGTGLGLSISKQAIESHRGQIKVISIEGSGTTFEITLPLFFEPSLNARESAKTPI